MGELVFDSQEEKKKAVFLLFRGFYICFVHRFCPHLSLTTGVVSDDVDDDDDGR